MKCLLHEISSRMKSEAENRPSDEKKNISKRLKMIPSSSYE